MAQPKCVCRSAIAKLKMDGFKNPLIANRLIHLFRLYRATGRRRWNGSNDRFQLLAYGAAQRRLNHKIRDITYQTPEESVSWGSVKGDMDNGPKQIDGEEFQPLIASASAMKNPQAFPDIQVAQARP